MRLAIVATHPIQYYAPLFRQIASRAGVALRVFYGWTGTTDSTLDPGFGVNVEWDIPLLDGYDYAFVPNESSDPGTHHFGGIRSSQSLAMINDWHPDALIVFGWNYQSHLAALRSFRGRAVVCFRGDSTLLDASSRVREWARWAMLRWVYSHVDVAFFVGRRNRDYFRRFGLNENQLTWAPHAVDNARFVDQDGEFCRAAHTWKAELGIPTESLTFLFVGKLEPKKAPGLLLSAFLALDAPNAHLVFAGTGVLEEELRARAGDASNVHFIGFQNQSRMPIVYRLGDVLVLPSRGPGETWGLAVNEAMACARPAVVSDRVGCAPDLIVEGKTGAVFPSGDVAALTAVLGSMLGNRATTREMGVTASAHISHWSIEKEAEQMLGAIERVLARRGSVERQR